MPSSARTRCGWWVSVAIVGVLLAIAAAAHAHNVLRSGSITCATSSTEVLAENRSRIAASVKNNDTVVIFIGTDQVATLTTANGYPLDPGQQWFSTSGYTGPVRCIVATATANLRFLDESR